jgi:2-dehydro-3-deoxyphosphogluconate aldolase / (4S)-4-hydroxy-2-oxoglutarate aldolase
VGTIGSTVTAAASETLGRIAALGLLPVAELGSVGDAQPLLDALIAGGLPAVEITLRTEAGLPGIGALRHSRPDALVGAGTVRSAEDARRVIAEGAQFVVSPGTSTDVLDVCRSLGVPAIPGVCTPTEVQSALQAGVATVKFFPAQAMGGVAFLKALAGPFRDVSFVPTGGVNTSNLADYLRLPGVVACGGSWMVAPALLAERRFDRVEELARDATAIVAEVRGHV